MTTSSLCSFSSVSKGDRHSPCGEKRMLRANTFQDLRPVFSLMPLKKESERHSARVLSPLTRRACHGATICPALVCVGVCGGVRCWLVALTPWCLSLLKKIVASVAQPKTR